jgi:hypothetical protein
MLETHVTFSVTEPVEFAAVLNGAGRSGALAVSHCDVSTGGLHDGRASGAPCVPFAAEQALNAGTSLNVSGDADFGRGWLAIAALAVMSATSDASASTSTDFLIMPPPFGISHLPATIPGRCLNVLFIADLGPSVLAGSA